jgi:hypothetical protein
VVRRNSSIVAARNFHSLAGRRPRALPVRAVPGPTGSVLDAGSQIVVIRRDLAQAVGAHTNTSRVVELERANDVASRTVGCAEYLPLRLQPEVGDVELKVHAHVVADAPFQLLLGQPFQRDALCRLEDLTSGDVEVSLLDPLISHTGSRTTSPHHVQSQTPKMHSTTFNAIPSYITRMAAILLLLFIVSYV